MNFIDKYTDPSLIIKRYHRNNNNYTVEYLDGSISTYYCSAENHEDSIREQMLNQITEIQQSKSVHDLSFFTNSNLVLCTLSSLTSLACVSNNKTGFATLALILSITSGYNYIKNVKKVNELKKYKMFIELVPHLDVINNSDFLRCIEFDKIYQKRLDINTVNDFTYGEVKTLYKKYKRQNKNNRD